MEFAGPFAAPDPQRAKSPHVPRMCRGAIILAPGRGNSAEKILPARSVERCNPRRCRRDALRHATARRARERFRTRQGKCGFAARQHGRWRGIAFHRQRIALVGAIHLMRLCEFGLRFPDHARGFETVGHDGRRNDNDSARDCSTKRNCDHAANATFGSRHIILHAGQIKEFSCRREHLAAYVMEKTRGLRGGS